MREINLDVESIEDMSKIMSVLGFEMTSIHMVPNHVWTSLFRARSGHDRKYLADLICQISTPIVGDPDPKTATSKYDVAGCTVTFETPGGVDINVVFTEDHTFKMKIDFRRDSVYLAYHIVKSLSARVGYEETLLPLLAQALKDYQEVV